MNTKFSTPEAIMILTGLLLRLAFALLPKEFHFILLEDDAWMVAAIARHWALGHGITADGLNPTNGFHPLYPLTLGAMPYLIWPNNLDLGFRINMIITALLSTLVLFPLYGLLRLVAHRTVACIGLAVMAVNPFLISVSVNAMETSLALLLLLLLWWYALVVQPERKRDSKGGIILGILAGLAMLARLDNMLAAAILGAVIFWQEVIKQRCLPLVSLPYAIVTMLLLLPYVARNLMVFGNLAPSSGRALSYMHSFRESFAFTSGLQLVAYQPAIDLTWAPPMVLIIGLIGLVGMAWTLAPMQQRLMVLPMLYSLMLTFYYAYLQQQGRPRYYVGVGVVVVLLVCAWLSRHIHQPVVSAWMSRRKDKEPVSEDQQWRLIRNERWSTIRKWKEATQHHAYAHRWARDVDDGRGMTLRERMREVFAPDGRGTLWERMREVFAQGGVWLIAIALVPIVLNSVLFITNITTLQQAPYLAQPSMYHAARWIAENLPPDARLAAQNSGVFQYYSERFVLNFDGKLNAEIIPVLEKRELDSYLRAKEIGYIVDLPGVAHFIEFYSSNLSDAPPHKEISSLGKVFIYAKLILAKVKLIDPVHLDERVPTKIIRPFLSTVEIVQEFPLPNDPTQAVTIYRLKTF